MFEEVIGHLWLQPNEKNKLLLLWHKVVLPLGGRCPLKLGSSLPGNWEIEVPSPLRITFFLSFVYFNWRLITLQYCGGFFHTLTWISHGCTCVPHPEPLSRLFPHPIPQGHPSAPAPSTLSHALNLDWRSISCMIIYMFQCYSLKSSHPRLLP